MRRLLTPRWVACHLLMVVLAAGMLALAGWQLTRAAGGNFLSWGYAFQWPVFAGFVVFVWAREARRAIRAAAPADRSPARAPAINDRAADPRAPGTPAADPGAAGTPPARQRRPVITRHRPEYRDGGDPELVAYNRYLAWLNANPGARPADYPG